MKKVLTFLLAVVLLSSCNLTTTKEDITFLQKTYPTVYRIHETRHIVVDSAGNVYDVGMSLKGFVEYKIRIK